MYIVSKELYKHQLHQIYSLAVAFKGTALCFKKIWLLTNAFTFL